jgi:hypothetical protein
MSIPPEIAQSTEARSAHDAKHDAIDKMARRIVGSMSPHVHIPRKIIDGVKLAMERGLTQQEDIEVFIEKFTR